VSPINQIQVKDKRMQSLLEPRSLVLVGASSTPGSLGESVLLNLHRSNYTGTIYLVNPKRPMIDGIQALGAIEELPKGLDCAVLAIPGAAVIASIIACAEQGIRSMIVFSAGFAESGEDGRAAQAELACIARQYNIVIAGPNCLGMVNYLAGIPLTFVETPPQEWCHRPGAAILSQSGALAAVIAVNMRAQRIPLTYSISTGNEAVTGIEDFLEHLLEDSTTRVFTLIAEQFRQPKRLLALARRSRALGKFLILLHPGRSIGARNSAATHTGAIAGEYEVMHSLVEHAGVLHVDSMEELVDVVQILVRSNSLPTAGAAIFTESGAFKALSLDLCEKVALPLPELSQQTAARLREALPPFIPPSNPLDLTAQGLVDPTLYGRTLPTVLDDGTFGSVLLAIILTDAKTTALKLPPILEALRILKPTKPVVFAALDEGAPFQFPELDELRNLGVACFPSPERAIRALAQVTRLGAARLEHAEHDLTIPTDLALAAGVLSEHSSKQILSDIGISIPKGQLARSVEEAVEIAHRIGFPVVMKGQATALPHKTEAGAVRLNLNTTDQIAEAWNAILTGVEAYHPGLPLDGVLVEKMGAKGVELIAGGRNDREWGPVLLVGFGGILAEAIKDTRILPADLSRAGILRELKKLRCAPLLHGFRGEP
jgi:acyl-CoA synthetase (NDP forming)